MTDLAQTDTQRLRALSVILRELIGSPGWDTYTRELADVERRTMEQLVTATEAADFARAQGIILGLRIAHTLPERIIQSVGPTPVK